MKSNDPLAEELGVKGEKMEEDIVAQEEEKKVVPKPKITIAMTKDLTPLAQMQRYDPILFKEGYARHCQKGKQPMVTDQDNYTKILMDLKERETELKALPKPLSPAAQKELREITRKIQIYENGMAYRNNYYFCPDIYDYMGSSIPDVSDVGVDASGNPINIKTGQPIAQIQIVDAKLKEKDKFALAYKYKYAGFHKQKTTIIEK